MSSNNRVIQPRTLLCSNDLVQSIKTHKLVEHKLFYHLYYYFKLRKDLTDKEIGTIDGYDPYDNIVYLDIYTTKKILGKRYSKAELKELIEEKMPKVIKPKNEIGFISIFTYIKVIEGYDGWEIEYKFTDEFIELASFEIPFEKPHTALYLDEMLELESKYSQRLYEVYKQYSSNAGKKGQGNFKMKRDYLYEFFNVPSSMRITEVLRKGIDIAIEELYDKIGAQIVYKTVKKGNKITHIHFYFN